MSSFDKDQTLHLILTKETHLQAGGHRLCALLLFISLPFSLAHLPLSLSYVFLLLSSLILLHFNPSLLLAMTSSLENSRTLSQNWLQME